MPYLDLSKISLPKDEADYNTWADYIELFCLLEADRSLSVEAIKDRLVDECGGDEDIALKQITGVKKALSITPPRDRIADDQLDSDVIDPENDQRIRTAIIDIITYLKGRYSAIPEFYPFRIDNHNNITANKPLSNENKIYVILLISSLIRIITRTGGFAYRITHFFEQLCEYPFRVLVPDSANVHFFGAGGYIQESGTPAIEGSFYKKVLELASRLNLQIHPIFNPIEAGNNNNGDGGLDWIAYMPFEDGLS